MLKVANTLPAMLLERGKESPNDTALLEKKFGIWHKITWGQYVENVRFLSLGMISLGLKEGDKVVFISTNRPEWLYTEMAVMAAKAVPLGMYAETEELGVFQELIGWSDAKFVVAEDQEQADKILKLKDRLPLIERIIVVEFHEVRRYKNPILMPYDDVLLLGRQLNERSRELFERNISAIRPEDTAILSTTSGTSALPKLAILTHKNLIAMSEAANSRDPLTPQDRMLSSNPPGWIGERSFGLCWSPLAGFCVCFAEEDETIDRDLREIGPSVLFSGPRGWENMISKTLVRIEDAGLLKKMTYRVFMPIGTKLASLTLARKKVPSHYRLLYAIGEHLLYKHLRDLLGLSKMRNAYTGGGFLGQDQFVFFHAIGVKLRQIYGGTEAGGVAVTQTCDEVRADTVGTPLPGIKIRVDETGEILMRGENIMTGYYKNPEQTEKALKNGWLYTGDYGFIEESTGHLVMVDRKNDIMTLNNGVKFSPQAIETRLKFNPYVKEAVCFGDGRDFVTALIQIDFDNVGKWAEQRQIPYTTFKDLSRRPEVYQLIEKEVKKVAGSLRDDLRVVRFSLFEKELDPEDGEITHTRKVRRGAINEMYRSQIEALYSADEVSNIHVVKVN